MGNEGGTLPKREDLVKVHSSVRTAYGDAEFARRARLDAARARWRTCAIKGTAIEEIEPDNGSTKKGARQQIHASRTGRIVDPMNGLMHLLGRVRAKKEIRAEKGTNDEVSVGKRIEEMDAEDEKLGILSKSDIVELHPKYVPTEELEKRRAGHRDDASAATGSLDIVQQLWADCASTPCCVLTETILGSGAFGVNNESNAATKDFSTVVEADRENTFVFPSGCGCVMLKSAFLDMTRSQRIGGSKSGNCPSCGANIADFDSELVVLDPRTERDLNANIKAFRKWRELHPELHIKKETKSKKEKTSTKKRAANVTDDKPVDTKENTKLNKKAKTSS